MNTLRTAVLIGATLSTSGFHIGRDTACALLAAMLARADVFIQNLAPGAMARAGFGSRPPGYLRRSQKVCASSSTAMPIATHAATSAPGMSHPDCFTYTAINPQTAAPA